MTTPITAATIPVLQSAQTAFEQAVSDLTSIVSTVFDSNQQLTTAGMVSSAGHAFGGALDQWINDFNDLRGSLQWMADMLGEQVTQMQQNEQNNTDLAAGIAAQTLPPQGFFSQPGNSNQPGS